MKHSKVYQNWLIDGVHTALELWIISRPNESVPRCLFSKDWYAHGSRVGPYNIWAILRRQRGRKLRIPCWMENDLRRAYGPDWKTQPNGKVITCERACELNVFHNLVQEELEQLRDLAP